MSGAYEFIDIMSDYFEPPKGKSPDETAAILRFLHEDIGRFPRSVYEKAFTILRQSRESRTFPPIAVCLAACRKAQDEGPVSVGVIERQTIDKYPEWSTRRQREAELIMTSPACLPMSVQAAKEGWIVWLWDHCREKQAMPSPQEASNMLRKFRENENIYRQVEDICLENDVPNMWFPMRKAILNRRQYLSNLVLSQHGRLSHER